MIAGNRAKMTEKIRNFYKQRYENTNSDYQILWGEDEPSKSLERFSIFDQVGLKGHDKILDLGCGFCDLYEFLSSNFDTGYYEGVDVVEHFLDTAKARFPKISTTIADFTVIDNIKQDTDYICIFGSLNKWWTLKGARFSDIDDVENLLVDYFLKANKGLVFNGFSQFSDYQKPANIYVDVFKLSQKMLSKGCKTIVLVCDRPKYEISMVFKK